MSLFFLNTCALSSLLHDKVFQSINKLNINAISALSNFIAEQSLHLIWLSSVVCDL